MPVERVPSFWDYLGQGFQRGTDIGLDYQKEQRARADAEQARKDAMQSRDMNLLTQIWQAGGIDAGTYEGHLRGAGVNLPAAQMGPPQQIGTIGMGNGTSVPLIVPKAQPVIQATVAERRRKAFATPGAIDKMGMDERQELGLAQRSQVMQEDFNVGKLNALKRVAGGERLGPQEYALYGVTDPRDSELERMAKMDPVLGSVADRHIATQILASGGRIDPKNLRSMGDKAYADYVAQRAQVGFGNLTPEEAQTAKSYFDRALLGQLIAQQGRDMEEYDSKTRRTAANAQESQSGFHAYKLISPLNGMMERIRKAKDDLRGSSIVLGLALNNPNNPEYQALAGEDIKRYQQYETAENNLFQALGMLAQGVVPPNIADITGAMGRLEALMTQQTGGPAGGGKAPPPAAGGGVKQQGTASPTIGNPGPGQQLPAPELSPKARGALQMLKNGQGNMQQLEAWAKNGGITPAELAEIKRQVGTR